MKTIYCQKHGITITSVIDGTLFKFMNTVDVSASDHWFHLKILIPIPDSSTATDSNNNKKNSRSSFYQTNACCLLVKINFCNASTQQFLQHKPSCILPLRLNIQTAVCHMLLIQVQRIVHFHGNLTVTFFQFQIRR